MSATGRILDCRQMVAPEPLEATLEALDTLPQGEELTLLINCQPYPLYQFLRRNGYRWTEEIDSDGGNVIRIRAA